MAQRGVDVREFAKATHRLQGTARDAIVRELAFRSACDNVCSTLKSSHMLALYQSTTLSTLSPCMWTVGRETRTLSERTALQHYKTPTLHMELKMRDELTIRDEHKLTEFPFQIKEREEFRQKILRSFTSIDSVNMPMEDE